MNSIRSTRKRKDKNDSDQIGIQTSSGQNISQLEKPKRSRRKPTTTASLKLGSKYKKILRQKHAGQSLSSNAKLILNSMVNDIFNRLVDEAINFQKAQKAAKRKTLTHRDMAAASSVLFRGSLQMQAKAAGTKAVVQYMNR